MLNEREREIDRRTWVGAMDVGHRRVWAHKDAIADARYLLGTVGRLRALLKEVNDAAFFDVDGPSDLWNRIEAELEGCGDAD